MKQHDLVVIGGGPGGYVAAIRAAQLGLNVACVEKETVAGGTCLRIGCIPSKAMLESSEIYYEAKHNLAEHGVKASDVQLDLAAMLKRKTNVVSALTKGVDALLKKNKVARYQGVGRIVAAGQVVVEQEGKTIEELAAKNIIIATGSRPASLPGIELDGNRVGTSTEALSYDQVPKHLVVVGGGYIGMELGSVWHRLGAKITVLEFLDRIFPGTDAEIAKDALDLFRKRGMEFRLGTRVKSAKAQGDVCVVEVEGSEPIHCDRVLVAVGRAPYTDGLGLENVGVLLDAKKRVQVDAHYQTSVPGIYAIGDCIPGPMLAHKAEEEGVALAEFLATGYGHVNYDVIPAVIYTHPEIAAVGKTEEQLQEDKIPYRKGLFPFRGNGRARTLADTDGKVKVLAHAETDRVLGVHIIGPRAGDLIAEAAAAMEFGASAEDIARTCHSHPTLSEALKEAAMAVDNRAIHF